MIRRPIASTTEFLKPISGLHTPRRYEPETTRPRPDLDNQVVRQLAWSVLYLQCSRRRGLPTSAVSIRRRVHAKAQVEPTNSRDVSRQHELF